MKGVVYRDAHERIWHQLLGRRHPVGDYVDVLGLEVVIDEAEGYAYLRSRPVEETGEDAAAAGRPALAVLPVSLLLALLRKKLAEFDAVSADTRLVLSREQIDRDGAHLPARQQQRGAAGRPPSTPTSTRSSTSASCGRCAAQTSSSRCAASSRRSSTRSGWPTSSTGCGPIATSSPRRRRHD